MRLTKIIERCIYILIAVILILEAQTLVDLTLTIGLKPQQGAGSTSTKLSIAVSNDGKNTSVNEVERSPLVLDVVSIGSRTRVEHQIAQKQALGSHRLVRTIFEIDEDDDTDQTCNTDLTIQDTMAISGYCHSRRYTSLFMTYMRSQYARASWLKKKQNPIGWICAQPRFILGLAKALRSYATQQNLPDYLVMMDDDTYLNVDRLDQIMSVEQSSDSKVFAGCLVRSPIQMLNFTFAWGGFGVVFSQSALENLRRPIACPTDPLCAQIEENLIEEKAFFRNSMSVIELMEAYLAFQPYNNHSQWTIGNCLHSDWMVGYMVNFYNISRHNDANDFYANVRQERTFPFLRSEMYRRGEGQCKNDDGKCPDDALVCHRMSPEMIIDKTLQAKTNGIEKLTNTSGS